jgi:zinc transport system substrate-binding protein
MLYKNILTDFYMSGKGRSMRPLSLLSALFALILTPLSGALAGDGLPVFVSILPQQYLVQQIGGEHVDVQVMVAPGASPATYEPKPRQMAALSRARLYFAIGVPFETAWLDKIAAANPAMQVVHTEEGIRKRPMVEHPHEGGPDGDADHNPAESRHGHGILDPHIWLSPPLVKLQAATIMEALMAADPAHAADYERNGRRFQAAIDTLDQDLKKIFAGQAGRRFMVFHPSWGYFAAAYGLVQVPIELEGKDPKPAQLQALIQYARQHRIKVIFVQPQFSRRSAAIVAAEIGGRVVLADPLALDWMENLRHVAGEFEAALQ